MRQIPKRSLESSTELKEQKDGLQNQIDAAQKELGDVETALSRVKAILSTRKNNVTLEAMAAEGRNAASRVLRERVKEIESKVGALSARIEELKLAMRKSLDRKKSTAINDFFFSRLTSFSMSLDEGGEFQININRECASSSRQ